MSVDADAVDLQLAPNEASDLARVPDEAVPAGFESAYVTVLDEGVVERSVAVLAHRRRAELGAGWEAVRLRLDPTAHEGRTEDAEACAFFGGHLYVLGSQYGSKDGPLQAKRSWIARMTQSDLPAAFEGERRPIEIARNPFGIHRAVNDALRAAGVELLPLGDTAREALIGATLRRGREKDKGWQDRIREDDHPVNIEGMELTDDGRLVLGLRVPVSASGDPLLVELADVRALFDEERVVPRTGAVWQLECAGDPDLPTGVRAMHRARDGALHLIVGSLDAEGKESALLAERPSAGKAHCEHWRVELPDDPRGGRVRGTSIHDFPDLKSVEGLAQSPEGHFLYVVDRDHDVHLRFLLAEDEAAA